MVVHHKRKNEVDQAKDAFDTRNAEAAARPSINPLAFVVRPSAYSTSWKGIQQQMKQLNLGIVTSWKEEEEEEKQDPENSFQQAQDDLLAFLEHDILPHREDIDAWVSQQAKLAQNIKTKLAEDLEHAQRQNALHMERIRIRQLRQEQHERARAELLREMDETKQSIALMQDEIDGNKHATCGFLQEREDMEEYRKVQEKKLRRRIALYAACTGIKWNFDAPQGKLGAQVMVPSKQEFRLVEMDHDEMDQFEIANSLWDIIEGDETTGKGTEYPSWSVESSAHTVGHS